ncbi:hypothetical protein MUU77_10450 [Pseudoxanthomonas sp. F37]|uniref:hypothetical protein n=1 Tax=Pseudoxanthomonas TaxID=83618 RepID=UPI001FD61487|nr:MULTISPECIES: hypothetical protein [Pseudoxanthomonas]UOV05726.1 hypothetical protein MUU75_03130 [Pseudoxanthomonas mexicana]UOV07297.1 hypothetical protein MUU77_10450 [Pseudoxanthomonas sp. F37]
MGCIIGAMRKPRKPRQAGRWRLHSGAKARSATLPSIRHHLFSRGAACALLLRLGALRHRSTMPDANESSAPTDACSHRPYKRFAHCAR